MANITGTTGNDSTRFGGRDLIGTVGDDNIFGLAGNDNLDGGLRGIDLLDGGVGDDNLSAKGQSVLNGGAGNDILFVGVGDGLGGTLDGGDGNDRLGAEDADDVLIGGAGNDILAGGFGSDTLIGEEGDDFYILNFAANANGDTIVERANEGIDTVQSDITFTLPDNAENLVLGVMVLLVRAMNSTTPLGLIT